MQKNILRMAAVCMMLICGYAAQVFSDDIKTRMIERLPVIKALKTKGIVGEDNKGFLQFIGSAKENEEVVASENQDRKKVYEAIAAQQGASADTVGAHRALQIQEKAAAGEWLQDASGKWFQK